MTPHDIGFFFAVVSVSALIGALLGIMCRGSNKDQRYFRHSCKHPAFPHFGVAVWEPRGVVVAGAIYERSIPSWTLRLFDLCAYAFGGPVRWPLVDTTQSHLTN